MYIRVAYSYQPHNSRPAPPRLPTVDVSRKQGTHILSFTKRTIVLVKGLNHEGKKASSKAG
jgi:hypothetical protein